MYFESHAHYDDRRFDDDREAVIAEIKEKGVSTVINIGADMKSSKNSVLLADKYDFFYAAVGVHPHSAKNMKDKDLDTLIKLAKNKKVVAIGEIGLDFHYDNSPRDIQKEYFIKQLDVAKQLDLPVVIHSREADQACYDVLRESGVNKGVIHCFSGSKELALMYVKLGFYLGIGGVVTYKNAVKTVEVVQAVRLENILIETDCPYLSPVPNRGERNDSKNLFFVVKKIAEIKQTSEENVLNVTKENGNKLFF